ncbi:MAG: glycoside hydrolase family 1 protein [Acidimicrobiales bacterium]
MQKAQNTTLAFPDGFLWGTATAAYQVEGSVNADDRGISIWDTFSHREGMTRNGDTGDVTSDHYSRLEPDLDLLSQLGAGAYRFSVAWPRIQPTGKGPANQDGVDFYRRLVSGLRERAIAPVLTLYHWDLPQALEDAGGWVERDTTERFAEYAAIVAEALGSDVDMWITLNEPWCSAWAGYGSGRHAPGNKDIGRATAATHHLLLAHGAAVAAIRSVVKGARVGITLNLAPIRAASNHDDDKSAARRVDGNLNRLFLDPLFRHCYPEDMLEHYSGKEPGFGVVRAEDLDVIAQPIDFLGVNFYSPRTVTAPSRVDAANAAGYFVPTPDPDPVSVDLQEVSVLRPEFKRTQMGWEIEPAALTELLLWIRDEYTELPIYITENGAAFDDYVDPDGRIQDKARVQYIESHLLAVLDALAKGVDARGYFVWSFLDNFEWAYGFAKRFGLVWVDYPSGARIPKESFWWYRDTVRANALASPPSATV